MIKIALILGTTNSGKSWLAGRVAAEVARPFVVVVHIHRDPSYLHHLTGPVRFVAVTSDSYTLTPAFLQQTRQKYRYLWLSVYDLSPAQVSAFLSSLVSSVKQVGDLALFIDEAHFFCSRYQVPDSLIGFIRGARKYGVDIVLITQRLKDIDIGIRCVMQQLVLFKTIEPLDLDVLATDLRMGARAEEVRALPPWHHLYVDLIAGDTSPPTRLL